MRPNTSDFATRLEPLVIGLIGGGLLPTIRAARMPVATAMREL